LTVFFLLLAEIIPSTSMSVPLLGKSVLTISFFLSPLETMHEENSIVSLLCLLLIWSYLFVVVWFFFCNCASCLTSAFALKVVKSDLKVIIFYLDLLVLNQ
jgi:hypothetical protein